MFDERSKDRMNLGDPAPWARKLVFIARKQAGIGDSTGAACESLGA
jgi:hypothetical protein